MSSSPTISIVVPAYNEESTISDLLSHLLRLGADEVVVVDGGSGDRTAELATGFEVRLLEAPACRAIQMNVGAKASHGEVLLFLHCDVRLGAGALGAIRSALADQRVIGGNLDILFEGSGPAAACFSAVNRFRRRWGIFYGDSGIFCRRSVFDALGGFRPWPIMEDYDFARRLSKAGRLAMLDEPILVSDRRWRNRGLFRTLASWVFIQGLYSAGVSPDRLAQLYPAVRGSKPERIARTSECAAPHQPSTEA